MDNCTIVSINVYKMDNVTSDNTSSANESSISALRILYHDKNMEVTASYDDLISLIDSSSLPDKDQVIKYISNNKKKAKPAFPQDIKNLNRIMRSDDFIFSRKVYQKYNVNAVHIDHNKVSATEGSYSFVTMESLDKNQQFKQYKYWAPNDNFAIPTLSDVSTSVECACSDCYYISPTLFYSLIRSMLPAFYEKNIARGQSFIKNSNIASKLFNSKFYMKLKYPENFVDLNGNRAKEKYIMKNGFLMDSINAENDIILSDNLTISTEVVAFDCGIKTEAEPDAYCVVDDHRSFLNADCKTGIITGVLCIKGGERREINVSVSDFINNIVCKKNQADILGSIMPGIIVRL